APVLHELRASLEGGAVLATHVDGDAPVLRDPTRLETRALGGEVDGVVVEPAPSWHGAGLARIAIRSQVEIARAAQRSGELGIHQGFRPDLGGAAPLLPQTPPSHSSHMLWAIDS